jgi:hypothetical protein
MTMTAPIFDFTAEVKAKGMITADDVLALRRLVWPDGHVDATEADAIFDLNSAIKGTSREWIEFFVEAITSFVVHEQSPEGYVDDAKVAWLMSRIDSDDRIDSLGELSLLVKILEEAIDVPDRLKAYALQQVETIVLTGKGPTRDGGSLQPGTINAAEVELLRRMLYAQASDGPALVSTAEADMLFRIKDATLGADDAPEWATFFVQAVGNHLMAHHDYRPLSRQRAAELDSFMSDTHVSIGGFFGRMLGTSPLDAFRDLFGSQAPTVDHDAAIAADKALTPDELAWLKSEVESDKKLDPIEKALLKFIADESGRPVEF